MSKEHKKALLVTFIFYGVLLLNGCATGQSDFNPPESKYLVEYNYYDTKREVVKACKSDCVVGCHRMKGMLHVIHMIKSKCVLEHEQLHIWGKKKDFHGNMKATCKVRD